MIWSCYWSNITKKKVTHLGTSIVQVFWLTLNIIPQWISKPWIKKYFKHQKESNDAGRFAINLRKCKYLDYDVKNCKLGWHNKRHSFKRHSLQRKPCPFNNTYWQTDSQRKKRIYIPSPRRQTRMLCANISCQDDIIRQSTIFKPSLLYSFKFDLNNNYFLVNSTHNYHYILNFPLQFTSNHVDPTTNLLDELF